MRASEAHDSIYTKRPGWSVGHRLIVSGVLSPNPQQQPERMAGKAYPATSTVVGTVLVAG